MQAESLALRSNNFPDIFYRTKPWSPPLRIYGNTALIMKTLLFLLPALLVPAGNNTLPADHTDTIYYVSLNRAIQLGQYDGSTTTGELKAYGDFGVGSAEKLSAELVLLDGVAYSIPADGKATIMPDDTKIPFAAVKFFQADASITINRPLKLKKLEAFLDSVIPGNSFAAIRVTGTFSSVKFRSFYEQQRPYKPLKKAGVAEFERSDVSGTLAGFYTPSSAETLNSPRYHFHFIDTDKNTGGHLLDCRLQEVRIDIDYAAGLQVHLPDPALLEDVDLDK